MDIKALEIKELPKSPPFRKLIGPSFILLGLGLGSGELILWPYLTANYGLGIIWGALLGITFQFFMNMEIERYALVNGESIFVGFARKWKVLPYWFIISTFIPWVWPGIIATSAKFLGSLFGVENTEYLATALLLTIGLILSFGNIIYKTVEKLQKVLIAIGVPGIFLLAIILANKADWTTLAQGIVGLSPSYFLLPVGIPLASFLAALAYAGAGGNLNLAQSFYVKEKKYGMGKYAGAITGLLRESKSSLSLTGATFTQTPLNLAEFKKWWRNINLEHFLVFWFLGSLSIILLGLLSYSTNFGNGGSVGGINFIFLEAAEIGARIFPAVGVFFLLISGLMLFGTQLTVLDATSRILSENLILSFLDKFDGFRISRIYYSFLWLQIAVGIFIFLFGFGEPLQLLILGAVLNAVAMFIHSGLTLWLNLSALPEKLRPNIFRVVAMILAFLFYGGFSFYTLSEVLF